MCRVMEFMVGKEFSQKRVLSTIKKDKWRLPHAVRASHGLGAEVHAPHKGVSSIKTHVEVAFHVHHNPSIYTFKKYADRTALFEISADCIL